MVVKPWDIYASELLPMGYGHPLWMPEPSFGGREVLIGDVGWLKTGAFRSLFNSMRGADDPINRQKGVPRDFQVFCPPNLAVEKSDKITQQAVFSRSIKTKDAQAEIAAVGPSGFAPIAAGAGLRFQTRSDTGAFVMLNPPGVAEEIESKRHIVNYMRDHFDSWLEFANSSDSWGLSLRSEDIVFICETLKTTDWAVAAFQGDTFRNQEGFVLGQVGAFGNAGFSVSISDHILPNNHYRSCPRRSPRMAMDYLWCSSSDSFATAFPPRNQCLFIHYYKMKRRLLWNFPMQASAGPHQLPRGPEGQDAPMIGVDPSSTYEFGPEPAHSETYDPVVYLLNYILDTCLEAKIAIASDLDLLTMFREGEFPHDIAEAIVQLSPSVEVDEHGVGTISVPAQRATYSPVLPAHEETKPLQAHNVDDEDEMTPPGDAACDTRPGGEAPTIVLGPPSPPHRADSYHIRSAAAPSNAARFAHKQQTSSSSTMAQRTETRRPFGKPAEALGSFDLFYGSRYMLGYESRYKEPYKEPHPTPRGAYNFGEARAALGLAERGQVGGRDADATSLQHGEHLPSAGAHDAASTAPASTLENRTREANETLPESGPSKRWSSSQGASAGAPDYPEYEY